MKCSASVVVLLVLLGASALAEEPPAQEPVAAEQPKEMPSAGLPIPKSAARIKAERQQRILELWSVMQQSGSNSEPYRLAEAERTALIREQGEEYRREMKGSNEQRQRESEARLQQRVAQIEEMRRQQRLEEEQQARKEAQLRAERAAKEAQEFAKSEPVLRAKCGEQPLPGSWDGSLLPVRHYMRQNANDPDSVSFVGCEVPTLTKTCWSAVCRYRAKNLFGATVLKTTRFWMTSQSVLKMKELD